MNLRIGAICLTSFVAIVGLASLPSILWTIRQRQFEETARLVSANGGSLAFEMVEGSYNLYLHKTTDKQVDAMLPYLSKLPTGFTLIGPGEDREFMIRIFDSPLTDEVLANLCSLDLASLHLDNCTNLTCASRARLVQLKESHVFVTADSFCGDALQGNYDLTPTRDKQ